MKQERILLGKTVADKVQFFHDFSFDPPDAVESYHILKLVVIVIFFLLVVAFPLYFWFYRQLHEDPFYTRLDFMDIEMQSAEVLAAASPALQGKIASFTLESSSVLRYQEQMCVLCQTEYLHGTSLTSVPPCDHRFHSFHALLSTCCVPTNALLCRVCIRFSY